ncbi:MAG: hypothetical protein JNJ54_28940 [Myxococcaceae bacterium]|nr:hypothetical protein [Myxococcaceae bacterium]
MTRYRFSSQPAWSLTPSKEDDQPGGFELLQSPLASTAEIMNRAMSRVEYRTLGLLARVESALASSPGPVVFATSPNDLPALLRTADQLLTFARQEAGERAIVWRCSCSARLAVPVSLMRPVSVRCDRCGRTLDLDPRAAPPSSSADPVTAEVNEFRQALSAFFREAMARGWPVLVSKVE